MTQIISIMSEETKTVLVNLKSKVKGEKAKARSQKFDIKVANTLLNMKKSQWELDDSGFTHNGIEIAKKAK